MTKILLVDDDVDQLALRSLVLQHHGFEPACASDPGSALEWARQNLPGVAVVDLGLPTEDQGWLLISRLKETLPELSIVVLTGVSRARAEAHPGRRHVAAWITKGSGTGALIETLQQLAA